MAWQVGHIAVAEYSLCLRRVRGRTKADESLISDAFIEAFKLGSKPVAEPEKNLPLEEIRRVFDAVHQQSVDELAGRSDAELDEPLAEPHPRFKTKLEAVEFCPTARTGARRSDRDAATPDGQAAAAIKRLPPVILREP